MEVKERQTRATRGTKPTRAGPVYCEVLYYRINIRYRVGQLALAFAKMERELPQFRQARFYDFNVFTAKKKREKLEYMHANPVMRGLVSHPKHWPWSSWSNYAHGGAGLIAVDLM